MEQYPKQISPNPLLNSTVEIRFKSDLLTANNALNFYTKLFRDILPNLYDRKVLSIQELPNQASYVFSNDDFLVFADSNVLSFGNKSDYKLWSKYFEFIKEILALVSRELSISTIERIGLRYASFLEIIDEDIPVLNFEIPFAATGYNRLHDSFSTTLENERFHILFQLQKFVTLTRNDESKDGILLDIDISQNKGLPNSINDELVSIIEELHGEEKKLFFSLLNNEYLSLLKPIY